MKTSNHSSIEGYIASYPPEVQKRLRKLRSLIQKLAPTAEEKISYKIPSYYLNGNLVHFAAYAKHIGFYPGAATIAEFADEIGDYKTASGTIQLPLDQPLPMDLVTRMVKFRVMLNKQKGRS